MTLNPSGGLSVGGSRQVQSMQRQRLMLALLAMTSGLAATGAVAAPDARSIEQKITGLKVKSIQPVPQMKGLFEVLGEDGAQFYVDEGVTIAINGQIYDVATRRNLSEESRNPSAPIAWSEVPLDAAFKRVRGNGRRQLAILADPDCPFCVQLEEVLRDIDDVTVYLLLYPLADLHPDAVARSNDIWCSRNRGASWDAWMLSKTLPAAAPKGCTAPIEQTRAFAAKLRANGTPTMLFESGRVATGALAPETLQYYLNEPKLTPRGVPALR